MCRNCYYRNLLKFYNEWWKNECHYIIQPSPIIDLEFPPESVLNHNIPSTEKSYNHLCNIQETLQVIFPLSFPSSFIVFEQQNYYANASGLLETIINDKNKGWKLKSILTYPEDYLRLQNYDLDISINNRDELFCTLSKGEEIAKVRFRDLFIYNADTGSLPES